MISPTLPYRASLFPALCRGFVLWHVICFNISCLYLGELEEVREELPPIIQASSPGEGEIMDLYENLSNKAFICVKDTGDRSTIEFLWNIGGEYLGLAENIEGTTSNFLCSEINIPNPDSSWDGKDLRVRIYNLENGLFASRTWTIEIVEGN